MKTQAIHSTRRGALALCFLALLVSLSFLTSVQAVTVPFNYTGANASFVVPSGVTQVSVKLWGAGGGSGSIAGANAAGPGGAGGFTSGVLGTTPGSSLTIIAGEGGKHGFQTGGTFGGGGEGTDFGSVSGFGGDGGGRSAVRMGSTELLTAGGGGGSNSSFVGGGGAGGGLVGADGGFHSIIGGPVAEGGTQTAGGDSNTVNGTDGSMFQGGSIVSGNSGGGAGGGFFGGGAGNGGGAGGSGYVSSSAVSGTTTGGSGITPPSTGDVDYVAGIAVGGQISVNSGQAGHGLIVITHNTPLLSTTPTGTPIDFGSLMIGDMSTLVGAVNLSNTGGTGTRITLGGASFANETQGGVFTIDSGDDNDLLEDGDFSELFDLTFDATGLTPGTYTSDLTFLSDFGNTTFNLSAFVEAPVPEPSTLTLAALGFLALLRRR